MRKTEIGNTKTKKYFFTPKDRQRHMHVIGSSGTGKSKFLELLLRNDLHDPNVGACLIDPHGSLVNDLMSYAAHLNPQLAKRIVYFNPANQEEQILGFNPIPKDGESADFITNTLLSNCLKAWNQTDSSQSPRIRRWLYNVFYPIVSLKLTLVEATPLVNGTDRTMRQKLIDQVDNPMVREDWENFLKFSHVQQQNTMEGAENRIQRFLRSEEMRVIFSQQKGALDFAKIMEEKKILLIDLSSSSRVHEEDMKLLGVMLLSEIFRVGMLRDDHNSRLPVFNLYVDEFGEYVTESVAKMLDQIRKKRVFVTLAHQHLAQLENEHVGKRLLKSINTNCRTKVVFGGLDTDDAEALTRLLFTGHFDLHEAHSELETTKVRTHEETRVVRSRNQSDTESNSRSEGENSSVSKGQTRTQTEGGTSSTTDGTSNSETTGNSFQVSKGKSSSQTTGVSETQSESYSTTRGTAQSQSRGQTKGAGRSESESESINRSFSDTKSKSHSDNQSKGESTSDSNSATSGSSSSSNSSSGTTIVPRLNPDGTVEYMENVSNSSSSSSVYNSSTSRSHTVSQTTNKGTADTTGSSSQEGVAYGSSGQQSTSENWSDTGTQSHTQNQSKSQGKTIGQGTNSSHSDGNNESESRGENRSFTKGDNKSKGRGESWSSSQGVTESESMGKSNSFSEGSSHSQGQGESIVPYDRKEEYKEVTSRKYYTIPEQVHRTQGRLMNLDIAHAIIKTANSPPETVVIRKVRSVQWTKSTSPIRIKNLENRIYQQHSSYYNKRTDVLLEAETRQRAFFDRPISYNAMKYEETVEVEPPDSTEEDQEVFNF